MPVNSTTWKKLAWVPRETKFDNDNALLRIRAWANGSQEKYASAFLWSAGSGGGLNPNNYRLPVGDIYNGKLTLVPRAIFSAATIVSGAHGGLENVVSDAERDQLKRVLTQIYDAFREKWNDRRQVPPWLRGGNEMGQAVAASLNTELGELPFAGPETPFNTESAKRVLWDWADGDLRQYRRGFAVWEVNNPHVKSAYKLPVAVPIEGELRIVPAAVTAAIDVLSFHADSTDLPDDVHAPIRTLLASLNELPDQGEDSFQDTLPAAIGEPMNNTPAFPIKPPADWFSNPDLNGPTPIAVTADGRVMGHLAAWNTCHAGIGDRCVMAPKSAVDYKFFLNGSVLTADGSMVRVGKITMGTGHADVKWGYVPASDHYDNTGTAVAVVASGEDRYGIWVAGSVVPEATEVQVQELRRSPLSGDWRRINGNLELVAALAVNVPGFPIVSMTASGEIDSLCAAGVLAEDGSVFYDSSVPLPPADRDVLAIVTDLEARMDKMLKLSRKAQLRTLLRKDGKSGL